MVISNNGACLPECMDIALVGPSGFNQTLTLNTSCVTGDLVLLNSYGAVEFTGYTCLDGTTESENNCLQDVSYAVAACNEGDDDITLDNVTINYETATDVEASASSTEIVDGLPTLEPAECYTTIFSGIVDRCQSMIEYTVEVSVSGPGFEESSGLKFVVVSQSVVPSPTSAPTSAPITADPTPFPSSALNTTEPTSFPSSAPNTTEPTPTPSAIETSSPTISREITIAPTPSMPMNTTEPTPTPSAIAMTVEPTNGTMAPGFLDSCNIDVTVELECPVIECAWDRCKDRPYRMEFRFAPQSCTGSVLQRCAGFDSKKSRDSRSSDDKIATDSCSCKRNITLAEEEWADEGFICEDFGGKTESDIYFVKVYPERDPSLLYFEGPLTAGGRFNATDPFLDRVDANMYLDVYDFSNGTQGELLQKIYIHSSCSQDMYILDIYGSVQLIEFESTTQLVTFATNPVAQFSLEMQVEGEVLDLDLIGVGVFGADSDLFPPQTEEFELSGVQIPPPLSLNSTIQVMPDEEFIVVVTVTGFLDGVPCTDISERIARCPVFTEPN